MKMIRFLVLMLCMNFCMQASQSDRKRPMSPTSCEVHADFVEMIQGAVDVADAPYYQTMSCDNDPDCLYNDREKLALQDFSDFTKLLALTAEKMMYVKNEQEKKELLLDMVDRSKSLGAYQCLKSRIEENK
jgi:hypothetical protein